MTSQNAKITTTMNAVWVDGDPLMEAIAAAIWEHCNTEGTSSVNDDPRNIAAVAATVARTHGAYTAAEMAAAEEDVASLEAEFPDDAQPAPVYGPDNYSEIAMRGWTA